MAATSLLSEAADLSSAVPDVGSEPIIRGDEESPSLESLYPVTPETEKAEAADKVSITPADVTDAEAAQVDTPGVAEAAVADASLVTGGPTDMSAAGQLAKITSQDSPLMQQAKKTGMLSAAKRGLGESTIAGQAAQAEMTKAALPLAQQDAATALAIATENADRETMVSILNAELDTDVSKFNAGQLNEAAALYAEMQTAVSLDNSAAYNTAALQFSELKAVADLAYADQEFSASTLYATQRNEMVAQTQDGIQALNEQYLAGSQAIDLAQIQGQYEVLISQNETAARIFDSYLTGISAIMANEDIGPERVAEYVQTQLMQVAGALQFIQDLNDSDLAVFDINPFNPDGGETPPPEDTTTPPVDTGGPDDGGGSGEGSTAGGTTSESGGITDDEGHISNIPGSLVTGAAMLAPPVGATLALANVGIDVFNYIADFFSDTTVSDAEGLLGGGPDGGEQNAAGDDQPGASTVAGGDPGVDSDEGGNGGNSGDGSAAGADGAGSPF